MKPIDNENNYKPMWPKIKKIVIEHIGKYFDFDFEELAHIVIDFNHEDLLNSRKKRDILMDIVVSLNYEVIRAKKDMDTLKCKIKDLKVNYEKEICEEKKINKTMEVEYEVLIMERNNLEKAVDDLTKMNIRLKSQNSELSVESTELESQNIKLTDALKKREEDYKKAHHNEKYYKDLFLDMEKKYYRLQKNLDDYMSEKNDGHSFSPVTSDNYKKNVYTKSQVQNPLYNISHYNPYDPAYFQNSIDFEIKMEALININKLERLDLFKKLTECIWDHRKKEIFSKKELWNKYSFNTSSKSTIDRYLKLFVDAGMIKSIGKGFYQVLF